MSRWHRTRLRRPPTERFTVADMARDIVAVLDDAGITRAHVVGVGLGRLVARESAAVHPGRFDRPIVTGHADAIAVQEDPDGFVDAVTTCP